jgi:hypothetical protein
MRPTRWPVLLLVAVVVGLFGYVGTDRWYDDLPVPHLLSLIWVAALAVVELYVAAVTRARLAGRTGTKPIHPISVARLAAFAKASSVVAAVVGGGYAGFFGWVVQRHSAAANHDTQIAAVAVALCVVLAVAALVLERVCRVKDDEDS